MIDADTSRQRQVASEYAIMLTMLTTADGFDRTSARTVSVSERENSRNLTPCEPVSVSEAPLADAVLTLTAARFTRDRRHAGTDQCLAAPLGSSPHPPVVRARGPRNLRIFPNPRFHISPAAWQGTTEHNYED